MELDILDKKMRRLVLKLKRHNIDLEVFDHNDITYGPIIGKGGEAIVKKCTVIYNGMPIDGAIKILQDNSDDATSITLDEVEMLCLSKDNVIDTTLQVYGIAAVPDADDEEVAKLAIITEAGIMNALQLYQQEDISLAVTLCLWSRIAAAVHMMHLNHIVHHDIKPENILIVHVVRSADGSITKIKFKIIDLGMGKRVFTDKITSDEILGTNGYHPPEVLFEDTYDFTVDIFTLGVTFSVMLLPKHDLKSTRLRQLLEHLDSSKKRGLTGKQLFDEVIKPSLRDYTDLPQPILSMIWRMLEGAEKRDVTLLEVVNTCRQFADKHKEQQREILIPSPTISFTDSGISSTSCREFSKCSSAASKRRLRPSSRNSTGSKSYNSSTRSNSPTTPYIKTRTQKRKALLSESDNLITDMETPKQRPKRKCTRKC